MHPVFDAGIPKVPHERIKANRIKAQSVADFLETVPSLIQNTDGKQATDGVVWMKEVNLERATMAHRAYRGARSASDLAMLDVVDIGRAFPAPPPHIDIGDVCSSQTQHSTSAAPQQGPAATIKITPHPSPHTLPTSPSATPVEFWAEPTAALAAEGEGDESATCGAVARSDFIKLLGYDGKKPASPSHLKWWSSPMDPLRRSSSLMGATSPFAQGPSKLGSRASSLGSALDLLAGVAAESAQDVKLQPRCEIVTTPIKFHKDAPAPAPTPVPVSASAWGDAISASAESKRVQRVETMTSLASTFGTHERWGSDTRLYCARVSHDAEQNPSLAEAANGAGASSEPSTSTASEMTRPSQSARFDNASGSSPHRVVPATISSVSLAAALDSLALTAEPPSPRQQLTSTMRRPVASSGIG